MRPRGLLFVAAGLTLILALGAGLMLLQPPDEEPPKGSRGQRVEAEDGARQLPGVTATEATPAALAAAVDAWPDAPAEAAAASPAAPAWPGVPHVLTGRVLDPSGAPLAGARVLLVPDAATLRAANVAGERNNRLAGMRRDGLPATLSGADGRFELRSNLLGWRPREEQVNEYPFQPALLVSVPGCALLGRACAAFADRHLDLGDLQVVPEARIEGQVVDESGAPLAGARIETDLNGNWSDGERAPWPIERWWHVATSDEQGRYVLEGLPAFDIDVSASLAGRVDASTSVETEEGLTATAEALVLQHGRAVAGRVTDPQGRPVAGARVGAVRLNLAQRGTSQSLELLRRQLRDMAEASRVLTDADGRFELRGLLRENVSVAGHAEGFEAAVAHDVRLGRRDLELALQPPAELLVSVASALGGAPVVEATLEARRAWNRGNRPDRLEPLLAVEPVADRPGHWLVRGAGPGATSVEVTAPGFALAREWADGQQPGARGTLQVLLAKGVALDVAVLDDAGAPLAGAAVALCWRDEDGDLVAARRNGRSDEAGRYRFEGLQPGVYAVTAAAEDHAPRTSADVLIDAHAPEQPLEVRLARAARLRVSVLRADGQPGAGQSVRLAPAGPDAEEREESADRHGRLFLADLEPGAWLVSAGGMLPLPVTLPAGEERAVELRLPVRCRIVGSLTSDGLPVAQADVGAWNDDDEGAEAETDEAGSFELDLSAGEWTVWARAPAGGASSASVTLLPGEQRRVELQLPAGRLAVRTQDEQGRAIAGAHVYLFQKDPEALAAGQAEEDAWDMVTAEQTGEDGRVEFTHLEPGEHRVASWGPEGWLSREPLEAKVSVEPAEDVVLTLKPAAGIRGQILASNGLPVADGAYVQVFEAQGEHEQRGAAWARGDDGRFEVHGLPAGRYLVCVRRGWNDELAAEPSLVEQAVTLAEGQVDEVTLILPRAP
jgi:protocatechuate 3,4-dioxygenase beta subunit